MFIISNLHISANDISLCFHTQRVYFRVRICYSLKKCLHINLYIRIIFAYPVNSCTVASSIVLSYICIFIQLIFPFTDIAFSNVLNKSI